MLNKYSWLLNPKGVKVEVESSRIKELLLKGFKKIKEPVKWSKKKIPIDIQLIVLNYYPFEGYGRVQQLLLDNITFNPNSKFKFILGYPHKVIKNKDEKVIFYTMFEADKIPEEWIEPANQADALIVPSEFCKESFKLSGVKVPIHIIPLGTDNFEPYESPKGIFTFLHYDYTSAFNRKGGDLVLRAFLDLFGNDDNCRLILKGRKHNLFQQPKSYPNVEYIFENYSRYDMEELLRKAHCFVFPSRGEGFGLPPIEAMSHGIPTILTNAHSHKDFVHLGIPLNSFGLMPSQYDGLSNCGSWVKPDLNHLKSLMWDIFKNYNFFKDMAVRNQVKVKELYDFSKISEILANKIKEISSKTTT